MSFHANSLFSTASTTQAGIWKPVNKEEGADNSLVATAFSPPLAQGADSVDVNPRGKALTGAAAKDFEKLDGKARDMLEGYVKSGVLTADDVVEALRGIAKEAVDARCRRGAPRTSEEMELGEKMRSVSERKINYFREMSEIAHSFSQKSEQVKKYKSGDDYIHFRQDQSQENRAITIADHKKNFEYKYESLDAVAEEDGMYIHDNFLNGKLSKNSTLTKIFFEEYDSVIFSMKDSNAVEKLFDAGFRPAAYRKAAEAFAAEVDLSDVPDLERPDWAPRSAKSRVKSASADDAEPATQSNTAPNSAAVIRSTRKTPGNDAILALLKANAEKTPDRQGMPGVQSVPSPFGTIV